MNRLTRQLVRWILTLSLAGLPFYASAAMVESSPEAPCHEMTSDQSPPSMLVTASGQGMGTQTDPLACEQCFEDCVCAPGAVCHGANSSGSTAILQEELSTSDTVAHLRYARFNSILQSRGLAPDITPPIA